MWVSVRGCGVCFAQVQFSLCMLRRLPLDHPDPCKRGKLQFMYTTLFEVKLQELVKGGEQTARLIGEAADKCTEVSDALLLHFLDLNTDCRQLATMTVCVRVVVGWLYRSIHSCTRLTQRHGRPCVG